MIYRILADLTLATHFGFILFVVFGGLLVAWRRWIGWVHVPAAALLGVGVVAVNVLLYAWFLPWTKRGSRAD